MLGAQEILGAAMSEYLTTRELADLLRIKERKVYDLAASGEVPCSRALGKLLFPRRAVDQWLASNSTGFTRSIAADRPDVFLGSHDPLLEWALRESRSGLATYFDGSADGLDRFVAGEGIASGLHMRDPDGAGWNHAAVTEALGNAPVVLVEWAWRERGLITALGGEAISGLADLAGRRVVPRQAEAGSQRLLDQLLAEAGVPERAVTFIAPARSETDAALAVSEGKAEAAFGLASLASQYRLEFVPVIRERFDLLVDRRAWFETPMQKLLAFCRSESFGERARELAGCDVRGLGTVHFNGPEVGPI